MTEDTTTPDLSEFLALSQPPRQPCRLGTARAALTDEDRVKLDAALARPESITKRAIEEWLKARGHVVPWQSVRAHRAGECACG